MADAQPLKISNGQIQLLDTTDSPQFASLGLGTTPPATGITISSGNVILDDGVLGLDDQSSDPSNVANRGFVYAKSVSTISELFFEDDGGQVIQLTSNGAVNAGGLSGTTNLTWTVNNDAAAGGNEDSAVIWKSTDTAGQTNSVMTGTMEFNGGTIGNPYFVLTSNDDGTNTKTNLSLGEVGETLNLDPVLAFRGSSNTATVIFDSSADRLHIDAGSLAFEVGGTETLRMTSVANDWHIPNSSGSFLISDVDHNSFGTNITTIGYLSDAISGSTAFGKSARGVASQTCAFGQLSQAEALNCSAFGFSSLAGDGGNDGSTALGANSDAQGLRCTAIGASTDTGGISIDGAIAQGFGATCTASNQWVVGDGGISSGITDIYFGQGISAVPAPGTVTFHSTPSSSRNEDGGDWHFLMGDGAVATATGIGSSGGAFLVTGGVGGAALASTNDGGPGGEFTVVGGVGGAAATGQTAGVGGALSFTAGAAGSATGGTGAAGGAFSIDAGAGTGAAANGDITIGGTNADNVNIGRSGGNIGFYGVTAVAQSSAYTPTNVTTDRTYDANSTTVAELADVLGTVIADLQATGILG